MSALPCTERPKAKESGVKPPHSKVAVFGVLRLDAALTFGLSFVCRHVGATLHRKAKGQRKRCQATALQSCRLWSAAARRSFDLWSFFRLPSCRRYPAQKGQRPKKAVSSHRTPKLPSLECCGSTQL